MTVVVVIMVDNYGNVMVINGDNDGYDNDKDYYSYDGKAGFPLVNIFARSDVFSLSLSFRLKPSGTN